MKATRDVITDLLPLYFSGEASADTKAMIEEYFAADPEFERIARRMAGSMAVFQAKVTDDDALEEKTLARTRSQLRVRNISLGAMLSGIAGCMAIGFLVVTGSTRNSTLVESYPVVVVACVGIFALLAIKTRKSGL